ncbi:protein of unknown function DUF21 [Desulfonatronum zhilinae]|nr:protein of unknown function DUF21 [Desulfonatronum zhilinae]
MSYASLEAVFILVLILVNGFFAMSEMALMAARKARLKTLGDEGSRRARVALLLKNKMDKFLSTAQIGITMVAILTGAVSAEPQKTKAPICPNPKRKTDAFFWWTNSPPMRKYTVSSRIF